MWRHVLDGELVTEQELAAGLLSLAFSTNEADADAVKRIQESSPLNFYQLRMELNALRVFVVDFGIYFKIKGGDEKKQPLREAFNSHLEDIAKTDEDGAAAADHIIKRLNIYTVAAKKPSDHGPGFPVAAAFAWLCGDDRDHVDRRYKKLNEDELLSQANLSVLMLAFIEFNATIKQLWEFIDKYEPETEEQPPIPEDFGAARNAREATDSPDTHQTKHIFRDKFAAVGDRALGSILWAVLALDVLGGIVGGVWLGILGTWQPLVSGFLLPIGFVLFYWLIMLPEIGLESLATYMFKKRLRVLPSILDLFGALYKYSVLGSWIFTVFVVFVGQATSSTYVPSFLWGFSIAASPLAYMASKEPPEETASWIAVCVAQIYYLMLSLSFFLGVLPVGLIIVALSVLGFSLHSCLVGFLDRGRLLKLGMAHPVDPIKQWE